jgi:5-methylcytosine-specific restriction enzyme subunit McrC
MLLYAWNNESFRNRYKADAESAPSLNALLASVLADAVEQRIRIGLGRGYINESKNIRGIRGRIDFTTSLKRLLFENGQAHCRFQTYSHNIPKNQIIRSIMARLIQAGDFGPTRAKAEYLRSKLRRLVRALDHVDFCEPSLELIRRQTLGRNDADYRLMLNICEFILLQTIPLESEGRYSTPHLDRSQLILYRVFEKFVANFFRLNLQNWRVTSQSPLDWHAQATSVFMPAMTADVILYQPSTDTTLVLDTKFTPHCLITNRWGSSVFDSSRVYQIYAYLRSQEHISRSHGDAAGILLYPFAGTQLNEVVCLQGHRIHFCTVNLMNQWRQIEERLLGIVTAASSPTGNN